MVSLSLFFFLIARVNKQTMNFMIIAEMKILDTIKYVIVSII